ncbi:MAG: Kelch repeat-containing protein, partial [Candidatus Kariarchaeaceae archaeon]
MHIPLKNKEFLLLQIGLLILTIHYSYTLTTTVQASPDKPNARAGHNMVYDEVNQKIILFGGIEEPVSIHNWYSTLLNDTWSYDLKKNVWKELKPIISPSPRVWHSMVYDSENNKIMLFGGVTVNDRVGDMWEFNYNTNTWTEILPLNKPTNRSDNSLIYDSKN